ncbi:TadE/TadG family type IV pilus assembly protein [Streptomyces sp. NPDC059851]|uniref:TadE/TadG family type IV pilus assembly protein n=1 Tax=Streptomyces sp. NPDC059851 TaxID=3346971 RepID=UPI00365A88B0
MTGHPGSRPDRCTRAVPTRRADEAGNGERPPPVPAGTATPRPDAAAERGGRGPGQRTRFPRSGPGQAPGRGPEPADAHARSAAARRSAPRGDRGQVALEYIGFVPVLLFVALCGIQLGWVAYVHEQADTAARTAARVEARERGAGVAAGQAAVRSGLAAEVSVASSGDAVTATVRIPIKVIVPGLDLEDATATAVMPDDNPDRDPKGRP